MRLMTMIKRKYLSSSTVLALSLAWSISGSVLGSILASFWAPAARADEADDLQTMIDRARRGTSDLRRLDELRACGKDLRLLDNWLDEAWRMRSEQRFDD